MLTVLVLVGVGVAKLRMSRLGSQMLAVRANERSAAGAGVAVVRVKIIAFAIGSFIAGLGGSMLGYFQGNVTFISFSTFVGLTLFATAYLAGITSISGGVLAGVIGVGGMVPAHPEPGARHWAASGSPVIAGVGLILTLIGNPEGDRRPDPRTTRRGGAATTGADHARADCPLDGNLARARTRSSAETSCSRSATCASGTAASSPSTVSTSTYARAPSSA